MAKENIPVAKAIERLLNYGIEKESTAMDEQTRRDVDEACLGLLGWTDLEWWDRGAAPDIRGIHWAETGWYGRRAGGAGLAPSPSTDPAFIVPLAEALRARFYWLYFDAHEGGWSVRVTLSKDPLRFADGHAGTLPEALATAAARAVGTENDK